MRNRPKWEYGDVIQIDPDHDPIFAGCLMVVTEEKPWGAQGYISSPDNPKPKFAFYRLKFENGVKIGEAEWIHEW